MSEGSLAGWLTREDFKRKQVSYAQNFEDILLARVFDGPEGFYIDIGANHPVFHSVTKLFYDRGWSGINIEPVPALHAALVEQRPRDLNLAQGVSDTKGALTFYEVPSILHGWSTFHPTAVESYRQNGVEVVERVVPVDTLRSVCERHVGDRTIDFLKIDAECYELQVLLGGDWNRWRPRVVLIEATIPDLVSEWESILPEADYLLACFDGLNRYYLRAEDRDLLPSFATPISTLDNAVSYEIVHLFEELTNDLLEAERRNGRDRQVVERLSEIERRHPRLAAVGRKVLRRIA